MARAFVNGVECVVYGFYEGSDINALVYYPDTKENVKHLVPMGMIEVVYDSEM